MKLPTPFLIVPSAFFLQPIIRGSYSSLNIIPSLTLFCAISSFLRSSASIYILLNLYILNTLPFLPTLFCLKKIGPGDAIKIAGAKKIVRMSVIKQPTKPPKISNSLFAIQSYSLIEFMLTVNTWFSPILSNCLR